MKKIFAWLVASVVSFSIADAASKHGNTKDAYERNQFVLQSDSISIASATPATGGSLKLYDFPDGQIIVHSCIIDVLATCGTGTLVTGQSLNFGVGTTANANGAWVAGETNLGSVAVAFTSAVTRAQSQLQNTVRIDGTATAADLYLNLYTTNALVTNGSATVQGTVHLLWSLVGDY